MKYDIIYADPPWAYRQKGRGAAENHYPVMSTDELGRLPIRSIASDKAICFMWATFPNFAEALKLMAAWGFEYKTCAFVWVKKCKTKDAPFMGGGSYTRANAEPLLLGTSKKTHARQQVINRSVKQIVATGESEALVEPRDEHSKKPDIFREKIVELLGDVPRIELFAREKAPGWDAWGNEIESDIDIYRKNNVDPYTKS